MASKADQAPQRSELATAEDFLALADSQADDPEAALEILEDALKRFPENVEVRGRMHGALDALAACRTEVRENGCGRIAMWRGHGIERLS